MQSKESTLSPMSKGTTNWENQLDMLRTSIVCKVFPWISRLLQPSTILHHFAMYMYIGEGKDFSFQQDR